MTDVNQKLLTSLVNYSYEDDGQSVTQVYNLGTHLERKVWKNYTQKWNSMKMEEFICYEEHEKYILCLLSLFVLLKKL